jgi:hypothetical protein
MMKFLLTGMMLCLAAPMALASGLDFTWNTSKQCPVVWTGNQDFDCLNNDDLFYMVASVVPNIEVPGFNALDARIYGVVPGAVPAWWQAFDPGSCREAAFMPGLPPTIPTSPCAGNATTKLWTTAAYGGVGSWVYDNSTRFHTVISFAAAANRVANLSTTTRYNAFNLEVLTSNSVYVAPDPDNGIEEVIPCAGCDLGVTLALDYIYLYGSVSSDYIILPMAYGAQCITWQGGARPVCEVPVRNTTWGQVKSLYR